MATIGGNLINLGTASGPVSGTDAPDVFVLGTGNVTLSNFEPDKDALVIGDQNGDGVIDIRDLQALGTDANGDIMMTLPNGSVVTMTGVKSFDDLNFVISSTGGSGAGAKALGADGSTQQVVISTGKNVTGTDGDDTIAGNSQDNTIDGGAGNDVFLVNRLDGGHDTYINLNLGDKMLVTDRNGDGLLDANDLAMTVPGDVNSALTNDAVGTTIAFADGTTVTLKDVHVNTFEELHVHIEGEYGVFE